jgi:hypothetical protein
MNIICTLYFNSKKLGTIISFPKGTESLPSFKNELNTYKPSTFSTDASQVRLFADDDIYVLIDSGIGIRVELQLLDNKVVDEPLRNLSSNSYIITTDKNVMHGGKVYQSSTALPDACQWKAIPYTKFDDIVDYKVQNDNDLIFLKQGYARELKDASYVLILPDWDLLNASCTLLDLLIKKADNVGSKKAIFIPFSGRTVSIQDNYEIDGKYIYLSSVPKFTGEFIDTPYTYTTNTLVDKYDVLQDRLNKYGTEKVDSICVAMKALTVRLKEVRNPFRAYSVYGDITNVLEKVRDMK